MRTETRKSTFMARLVLSLLASCAACAAIACSDPTPLRRTTADLQPIHVGVIAAGTQVRQVERVSTGDRVATDATGRARLRLDDGTSFVIDRATTLVLEAYGVVLEEGRVFVTSPDGVHSRVDVAGASVILSGSSAAFARLADAETETEAATEAEAASVFSVDGELTLSTPGAGQAAPSEVQVRSGETARISRGGAAVEVKPERAFEDWTEGLAVPWAAERGAPRRAVGELWGRTTSDSAGSPLTIRAHDIETQLNGEVAVTRARTTYFNSGSGSVTGDLRMALPRGAIVSRFAFGRGEELTETNIALASRVASESFGPQLEWAGDGWVRARLPQVDAGSTLSVEIEFVEWLEVTPRNDDRLSTRYRYPLTAGGTTSPIGEFSANIDASRSAPLSLAAGMGAETDGQSVRLRRSDWSPSADLVVDTEFKAWESPARLYVADAPDAEGSDAGRYVMVRTELPEATTDEGVAVVLVLDVSASAHDSMLETSRSFVRALLGGLDSRDRAVVLAADQTTHAVGPATLEDLTDERKGAILAALDTLRPGGATDIGRALEAGADLVPADSPETMLVYVGDGWSTVGDTLLDDIEARLVRRRGRLPRLGAVSVGPTANRALLAGLVGGSGPLLEAGDSAEAATAAIELVSAALQPTLTNVGIDLGPDLERVYPRRRGAVAAGSTLTFLARARGALPSEVRLHWRDAQGERSEIRKLSRMSDAPSGDLRRRWARARVEEILLSGGGREPVTEVALVTGLITPWTAFVASGDNYAPTPSALRLLDNSVFSTLGDGQVSATRVPITFAMRGALLTPTTEYGWEAEEELSSAAALAIRRKLRDALPAVRACRDSRPAPGGLPPEQISISLSVDGSGTPSKIRVGGRGVSESLGRCIRIVVSGLSYPRTGLSVRVDVTDDLAFPAFRSKRGGTKCSDASRLPMPLRRGIWKQRLISMTQPGWAEHAAYVYFGAKRGCEIRKWRDRRALLEVILLHQTQGTSRFAAAARLAKEGEDGAADFLRSEAIRRAQSPQELRQLLELVTANERLPRKSFEKDYRAAKNDAARLRVVRRYLVVAPHSALLRGRLIALLESLGERAQVVEEVRLVRGDPFADAALLADGGAALRRLGYDAEARRAFGELTERAPSDPWIRAFLGDRLRNEGWFDDATATYAVLDEQIPNSPPVIVRHALSHAGAGRLDIARRMLTRVAQTGGREADGSLAALANVLSGVLLAEAIAEPATSEGERALLRQTARQLPHQRRSVDLLVRAPAAYADLKIELIRGEGKTRETLSPALAAPGMGLYAFSLSPDRLDGATLRLAQPEQLEPASSVEVRIDALVRVPVAKHEDSEMKPRLVSVTAALPSNGKSVDVAWVEQRWSVR